MGPPSGQLLHNLGPSWSGVGPYFNHLGPPLGTLLEPSWSHGPFLRSLVGASSVPLGTPLGAILTLLLELFLSPLRPSSEASSGHFLRHCRAFASGPLFRTCLAFLGAHPGILLRPLWAHHRALLGRLLRPSCATSCGFSGPFSSLSWAALGVPLGAFLGSSWTALWSSPGPPLGRPWNLRRAPCRESSLLGPRSLYFFTPCLNHL